MNERFYNPAERERQKQAARDRDEEDMAAGRISAEDLQRRNGFIPEDMATNAKILTFK